MAPTIYHFITNTMSLSSPCSDKSRFERHHLASKLLQHYSSVLVRIRRFNLATPERKAILYSSLITLPWQLKWCYKVSMLHASH